jgi:hypothetical protein
MAELLRDCREKFDWQMVIVGTGRTEKQQAEYKRIGTSRATRSLHQPQLVCGLSHAGDFAPYHLMQLKNWAPEHPDWLKYGELAESKGLLWGGRWSGKFRRESDPDYKLVDCPHVYIKLKHDPTLHA